jgi:uncharacterized protein
MRQAKHRQDNRRHIRQQGADMGDMARENSMEDILSSIRRVIAREDQAGTGGDVSPEDDVLELVQDDAAIAPVPSQDADEDAILAAAPKKPKVAPAASLTATVETPAPKKTQALETAETGDAAEDAALIAGPVAEASRSKLSALSALVAKPAETKTATGIDGATTVDALVRDAIRPMLKEWLDANLPEIVEGMVAKEISRITGRNF